MFRVFAAAVALTALAVTAPAATLQASDGIVILSGQFGTLGAERKLDITARLQQFCGVGSDDCSVFCSETSFGLHSLGRRPICRVAYRCPDASTRSVEAAREEPILLSCRELEAEPEQLQEPAAAEAPLPPPYVPPAPGR